MSLQSIEAERKLMEVVIAVCYAIHSIYESGMVWEGDMDRLTDAVEALADQFDPTGEKGFGKVIQFPPRPANSNHEEPRC